MDYTQTLGLIQNPLLRDLLAIAVLIVPLLVGWWNRTHIAETKAVATLAMDAANAAAASAASADGTAEEVVAAVTPNHGSSLADAVNRIETTVNNHTKEIASITRRLNHHIVTETLTADNDPQPETNYGDNLLDQLFDGVPDFPQLTRVPANA